MKAFPQKYPIDASKPYHEDNNPLDRGMELRDYFASKAMQSLLTVPARELSRGSVDYIQTLGGHVARWSYEIADEMMKAREQ
jgi:hypothetical protein